MRMKGYHSFKKYENAEGTATALHLICCNLQDRSCRGSSFVYTSNEDVFTVLSCQERVKLELGKTERLIVENYSREGSFIKSKHFQTTKQPPKSRGWAKTRMQWSFILWGIHNIYSIKNFKHWRWASLTRKRTATCSAMSKTFKSKGRYKLSEESSRYTKSQVLWEVSRNKGILCGWFHLRTCGP